ncbi:hypothetical protein [Rhodococcus erythropolis]|uniref:hypothetical protein n=1 Tax=Rhodococcus erythropolis TaxID=1833 RepID=UPI00366C848D
MNIPDLDGAAPLSFAGVFAGVQQFFDDDAVVLFYFSVAVRGCTAGCGSAELLDGRTYC